MTVTVKLRKDNRPLLMMALETATGKAMQNAALLCREIARKLVSKRYEMTTGERARKNLRQRIKRRKEKDLRAQMQPQQQAPSAAAKVARSRERRAEMQRRRRQRARDAAASTIMD